MIHRQNLSALTFQALLNNSQARYSDNQALGFDNERMMSYAEMHEQIKSLQQTFADWGIGQGDKVAIFSHNSPNWAIAYFATVSMGAIAIPMLPDLQKHEIINILEHSEAKLLLVSERLESKFDEEIKAMPERVALLDDMRLIKGEDVKESVELTIPEMEEDDLAVIIYTSGTTGNSKAVMLSHKNLIANAIQGDGVQPVYENDRFLSVLPLSHAYENTLGLLLPVLNGASVTYLRKPPTASVLMPALKRVKPTLVLTVPMIIEKIVRKQVFAKFENGGFLGFMYKLAPFRRLVHFLAGKKIKAAFGGELKFFGIGGAKLDAKVERFLLDAKFPYAIGYGLTETAPLSAGCAPFKTKLQSTGPAVKDVDIRISDGHDGGSVGEVLIKGPNVMQGYYKNPVLTKEVFTDDGYFRSGDLGIFDRKGRLYLRGRTKNMILGANGENIYPEDIESVINNYSYVTESVVVERKGKLVALVHFDRDEIEEKFQNFRDDLHDRMDDKLEELRKDLQSFVNSRVNKYSRLQLVVVQPDEFEKTATHKIKRFMYE